MEQKRNILYVRMFGGFSAVWNGRELTGTARYTESQFICLLQLLLHNRENGVDREMLLDMLYRDREIRDPAHSLHVLLYNTRKRLAAFGLPNVSYVVQRGRIYYWTKEIPVVEDAEEFNRLYQAAENEKDPDRRLRLYMEACGRYTGDFLPMQAGDQWVAEASRQYQDRFHICVERAAELLRAQKDYIRLEELGRRAAKYQPFLNWECLTLEALTAQERWEEADRFFNDTKDLYYREMNLRPDLGMVELHNLARMKLGDGAGLLDAIQAQLSGRGDRESGGYLCAYPVFDGIYRIMERMLERSGQSVYLMLCTLVNSDGYPLRKEEVSKELARDLEASICASVRSSDAVTRYGTGQYLILLINTTLEDCGVVQERIRGRFAERGRTDGLRYYAVNVFP